MKYILIALFLVSIFNNVLAQGIQKSDKYQLAITYEQNGDLRNASRLYQELFAVNPKSKELLAGIVRTMTGLQRHNELLPIIEEYLKFDASIDVLAVASKISKKAGQFDKSQSFFEQSIKKLNKNSRTFLDQIVIIASTQSEVLQFQNAIQAYLLARDEISNQQLFAEELSQLYAQTGDYTNGMKEILTVFKQQQNYSIAQGRISALLTNEEANLFVDKVLKDAANSSNDYPLSKIYLWYLRETKRLDDALQYAIDLDNRLGLQGRELMEFAELSNKDGAFDYSIKAYGRIIDKGKNNLHFSGALYGYAKALEQKLGLNQKEINKSIPKDDIVNIIQRYKDIIAQFSNNQLAADCLFRIGLLQSMYLNDYDEAIESFEKLKKQYSQYPISANGNNEMSLLYIVKGDLQKAKQIANDTRIGYSRTNTKESDRAQYIMAEIAFFEGNIDTAKALLLPISGKTESDIANDALELSLFLEQNVQFVNGLSLYGKAMLQERGQQFSDAAELYDQAYTSSTGSDLAERSLIKKAEMMSRYDKSKSIASYELFLQQFPESIRTDKVLFTLSEQFIELGDTKKANDYLTDILVRFPTSQFAKNARELIRKLRGDF